MSGSGGGRMRMKKTAPEAILVPETWYVWEKSEELTHDFHGGLCSSGHMDGRI